MIKALVFSDLHLSNRNTRFRKRGKVSTLLTAQAAFVDQLASAAREDDDVEFVIFCGDYVDYINLDPITLAYLSSTLHSLDSIGKPVFLLVGNHGIEDKQNFFTVLGSMAALLENVEVIYEPQLVHVADVDLFFVPYMSNEREMISRIKRFNDAVEDSFSVLICHTATKNSMMDNGLQSPVGIHLQRHMVNKFDLGLFGDFHKPQEIPGVENMHYVGAPFDLKFGESLSSRGYLEVKFDWSADEISTTQVENQFYMPLLDHDAVDLDNDRYPDAAVRVRGATLAQKKTMMATYPDKLFMFQNVASQTQKTEEVEEVEKRSQDDLFSFMDEEVKDAEGVDEELFFELLRKLNMEI